MVVRRLILLFLLLVSAITFAEPGDENWSAVGDPFGPSGSGSINAIVTYGNDVYVGGAFTGIGENNDIDYLAKWDGSSWSAIGTGVNGAVGALAVDGTGSLYVGGGFSSAGGVANTRYLAKWDGSNWISLGLVSPQFSSVEAMVWDSTGNLIVGGNFSSIGGVANTQNIARWNGSSWSALASGLTDIPLTLAADNNGNIYAGGYSSSIMRWNGVSWSVIGVGNDTLSFEIDNDNSLIVGGYFLQINGVPDTQHIARWNGVDWSSIVPGVDNDVHAVHVDGTDTLYMGGYFWEVNGIEMPYLAKWNGYVWSPLGSGPYGGPATVLTEDASGNIFVGSGGFLLKWTVVDTDGDNFQDYEDMFPDDPAKAIDFDDDGYDDREDNCPLMYNNQDDFDSDNIGDECDDDVDGDGLSNFNESDFGTEEYNPDTDWDGLLDGYEVYTSLTDPVLEDTDADGLNDYDELYTKLTNPLDPDSDDDSYGDAVDDLPLNPTEWIDTDSDGTGNNADVDDDNDGLQDIVDNCPVNHNPDQLDTDIDSQGNLCDSDDDNDGVTDLIDNCQLIFNANQRDSDGDSRGDVCDALPYMPFKAVSISGGGSHTCAKTESNGMKCWGSNNNGQLGDNTVVNRSLPGDVMGLTNDVGVITAGSSHTCVVTADGGVKCWGYNAHGQLGDNSVINRYIPVNVTNLTSDMTAVSAGDFHVCAVTNDSSLKCWGIGGDGRLGDGFSISRSVPVDVIGSSGSVNSVVGGYSHTCALSVSGGMKCWGDNGFGQLGDNTTLDRYTPVDVTGLANGVDSIVAGNYNTCALTAGSGVKCWGNNNNGQLGDGTTINRHTPIDVLGLSSGVIAITAGSRHVCALMIGGGVKCWGNNNNGQLGDGTTINRHTPIDVLGLSSGVIAIAAGGAHTCALTVAGGIKCWGRNFEGQLADTTNTQRNTPVYVSGFVDDSDSDGVVDPYDNCPTTANQDQADTDGDTLPDACTDSDDDNDGIADTTDNFPLDAARWLRSRHNTDTDNDSDVLVRATSTGTWTRHTIQNAAITGNAAMSIPISSDTVYVAQLDANGDGDADILTRSASTGNWTLHEVQAGAVTASYPISLYLNTGYIFVGTGDFNNDGTDDVMLRDATQGYRVFLLNNHAVSSVVFYNAWLSADSVDQGIGDFDGDGTDDLLVRRSSDNIYFIFKTANGAVSNYYCACNLWRNSDWTFQFAGDTNKDGIDDIVIRATGATGDGKWWAFRMANFYSQSYTNLNLYANKTRVSLGGWGDYNADGVVDVLTRVDNATTYVSPLNNGLVVSNNWLYGFTADQVIQK